MISREQFDGYWAKVEAELAETPAAPEEEPLPIRSTDEADCWTVRLTGIGPYRLFAYLSIPHGEGPFPALYQVPRIRSVVEVLTQGDPQARRARYVTFSLAFRGQRNADQPYAAPIPGMLTEGIEDPETYLFRGAVADVLCGFDYLVSRPEIDPERVVLTGANDLALLLAGMRPQAALVATDPGPFHNVRAAAAATDQYPLEEVNDYLRMYPEREEAVFRTLAYFDPLHVAEGVRAATLLWVGPEGSVMGPGALRPLAERLGGPVRVEPTRRSRYLDGKLEEDWITSELGFDTPIYPEAWK